MKYYLIHGFNVKDGGAGSIDKLIPHIEANGDEVIELDYGYINLVRVRLCNGSIARVIANTVKPGSVAIAHSNGAAIVYAAARVGAKFGHVTLINPALDESKRIDGAGTVDVWYATSDVPTRVSRFLLFHPWGDQGQHGFSGYDPRYRQFNSDTEFGEEVGHSGVFKNPAYCRRIVEATRARRAGQA